jgi:hypothetical protein
MIAAMLLIVGMVGSIATIVGLLRANQTARSRDIGYFLAQEAIDQIAMIPLVGNNDLSAQFPSVGTGSSPNGPLMTSSGVPATNGGVACFPLNNDTVADRPVPCTGGNAPPTAYVVRTWTCCTTAGTGLILGTCQAAQTLTTPDTTAQAAVCYIQAEVSWPLEDPTGGHLVLGSPLLAEPLFADPPIAAEPKLTFGNHVWATMVREQ